MKQLYHLKIENKSITFSAQLIVLKRHNNNAEDCVDTVSTRPEFWL